MGVRVGLFIALVAACGYEAARPPDPTGGPRDAGPREGDANGFPETGIGATDLLVAYVVPDHGPFRGGNEVLVRGTGFGPGAEVTVGGRSVVPAPEHVYPNRLRVVVPPGEPGPADVVVRIGDRAATLPGGYLYDPVAIAPDRGPTGGGTRVTIEGRGTAFAAGDRVVFGLWDCTGLSVVSSTRMSCRAPPGPVGPADVRINGAGGREIVVEDGFLYDDGVTLGGGLDGGPIAGSLHVTVLDEAARVPLTGAFVIVGDDPSTPHQGRTDLAGQIGFSGDDLAGRQALHVLHDCHETTSFVGFDASEVTVFLPRRFDPACGAPGAGHGRQGAYVSGELVWPGRPWEIVPPPRGGEIRVAYVFTSQTCAGDEWGCASPDPSIGGSRSRLLETGPGADRLYRIYARPSPVAVWAVAGIERVETGELAPYVMGVTRNVLVGPGEEATGVDIAMDMPLDHGFSVFLAPPPDPPADGGPDRFRVSADIVLGADGVLTRRIGGELFDVIRRPTIGEFRFGAQPALFGALAGGGYRIEASFHSGDFEDPPRTVLVRNGVREVEGDLFLDGWLGVPLPAVSSLSTDRVIRWTAGGLEPSLHAVVIAGSDLRTWRLFAPGDVRAVPIPDLSSVSGIDDIAPGPVAGAIYAVRIPGFDFDAFRYRHLDRDLWTAWAENRFTASR
jgi:hypothetical protein